MKVEAFFDSRTSTLTYVVYDPASRDAVVIDPVLDYDAAASKTWTESVDRVSSFLHAQELTLHYVMETHAHADHLSGSQLLKERFAGAKTVVGARITRVQEVFKEVFDLPAGFPTDGRQFDVLLEEGDTLRAGTLAFRTLFTPGHTPADVAYRIEDAVFTGDVLFMPDFGTGRCDFPAGSAADLFASVKEKLYALPDDTRVFVGHDYQPGGRELRYESTIGEQKRTNKHIQADTTKEEFVRFRVERDRELAAPALLFQSVQVNVDAGRLPDPSANEVRYLKIPINVFRPSAGGEVTLEPTR
ncbi:MAG: MBL fold metallo-hydrolase [Myxococcota bacterium]